MFSHLAFDPYRATLDAAYPILGDARWISQFNEAAAHNVQLIADETERGAMDYERFIYAERQIPTRVGALHDLMNAAVWRKFPLSKRALNAKHIAEGENSASANRRSVLRDGLTLFDESGVVIVGDAGVLPAAHTAHDWQTLFVSERAIWQRLQVVVFGHGLLESLAARAHLGLVGKTLWLDYQIENEKPAAQIDTFLSKVIKNSDYFFKSQLRPLPLCGVPGWDSRNDSPDFYSDARIFRPLPTIRK